MPIRESTASWSPPASPGTASASALSPARFWPISRWDGDRASISRPSGLTASPGVGGRPHLEPYSTPRVGYKLEGAFYGGGGGNAGNTGGAGYGGSGFMEEKKLLLKFR